MSKHTSDLTRRKRQNMALVCKVPGCNEPRHQLGGHCGRHTVTFNRHGHPEARAIRPREYRDLEDRMADFVADHGDHPAIIAGTDWAEQILRRARVGDRDLPALQHWQRLEASEVSARAILIRAITVYLFVRQNPPVAPDGRSLAFALAAGVFQLAPWDRTPRTDGRFDTVRPSSTIKNEAGTLIRDALVPLLVNVERAMKRKAQEAEDARARMRVPL